MSKRIDILDGQKALSQNYGLVYTCNLGWLDLGHMHPESTRPHTGASALWKEINAGGPDVRHCLGIHPQICTHPSKTDTFKAVTFPDKKTTGFKVVHRQDMHALGKKISSGVKREYVVKHNLSPAEKKSVALAIFMEVSLEFEAHQEFFPNFITDSGFSQEDLVSNLIGFHIAIGTVTKAQALAMAKPVSKETALAIWDRNGSVGSNKNRGFKPMFSPDTSVINDKACINECGGVLPRIPEFLAQIKPAKKGTLFINNALGGV
ncbi:MULTISPECIES: hypothetical protein [unclassified Acidovorax]|uniref:hypothetical protein n=1 Tax=unclassified Acidovorax TaxID=2684926 RepID=UPI0023DE36FD|nr:MULTISPECIES: hypothetical protein [unclassified Acidovorax]GKS89256.1 hypothetical protein AVTE2539_07845 [Acidovorax sp. SUPP2539]GKT01848.1 hypothetical protein AVKW3434_20685 [Acidovorax sp. SUPP3434]